MRKTLRILQRLAVTTQTPVSGGLIIFKPDRLGDFILATGCIRRLDRWSRETLKAPATLIVSEVSRSLAAREFPELPLIVSEIYDDSQNVPHFLQVLFALRKRLLPLRGRQVACLRHQRFVVHELLLAWLSPATIILLDDCPLMPAKPPQYPWRRVISASYPVDVKDTPLELEAHARVASLLMGQPCSPQEIAPKLTTFPTRDNGELLVFPYGSDFVRNYPPDRLLDVLRAARQMNFTAIRFCAGNADEAAAMSLVDSLADQPGCSVLMSITPNIECAAKLIAGSRMVLSMESGPAHLAIALDKAGIFILGGGHHGIFAPWGSPPRQHWIDRPLPCYHCNWKCIFDEAKCITEIAPSRIIEVIQSTLESFPPHPFPTVAS